MANSPQRAFADALAATSAAEIDYYYGTNWVALGAGTAGQHLIAAGAAAPAWTTVASLLTTLDTPQATTSGSNFTFTAPGLGVVYRATCMFENASPDDADDISIRIGDGGGIEATGYDSVSINEGAGGVNAQGDTLSFTIRRLLAGDEMNGNYTLTLTDASANTYTGSHTLYRGASDAVWGGGSKSLTGALTTIQITDVNGDAWDNGSVNVLWEELP